MARQDAPARGAQGPGGGVPYDGGRDKRGIYREKGREKTKKLILSAALLALLAALSLVNSRAVSGRLAGISEELQACLASAEAGDWTSASGHLGAAEERWTRFAPYREVTLRHQEQEEVTAALPSLREAVENRDEAALRARTAEALQRLESMAQMETARPGSVF